MRRTRMRFPLARWLLGGISVVAAGLLLIGCSVPTAGAGALDLSGQYDHLFVMLEENDEYTALLGDPNAPGFNELLRDYGVASNYYGVAHPSEPNYVALIGGNAYGIGDDAIYSAHQLSNTSLVDQLEAAGKSWRGYFQSMPSPGYTGECAPSAARCLYASKHNGFLNFSSVSGNLQEMLNMVPDTQLATDLAAGHVASFSMIVPDQCHDMHGQLFCPDDATNTQVADSYLQSVVQAITGSSLWQHGHNAIVVTFDEGDSNLGCCDANPGGGRIAMIVITNRGIPAIQDDAPYNHYSLLASIERAFGLGCTQLTCDTTNVQTMDALFGFKD